MNTIFRNIHKSSREKCRLFSDSLEIPDFLINAKMITTSQIRSVAYTPRRHQPVSRGSLRVISSHGYAAPSRRKQVRKFNLLSSKYVFSFWFLIAVEAEGNVSHVIHFNIFALRDDCCGQCCWKDSKLLRGVFFSFDVRLASSYHYHRASLE